MNDSQRSEINQSMYRTTGSYELVLSPVILALLGYMIDRWLGTVPLVTIITAVLGLAGAAAHLYYGYRAEMEEHEVDAPWRRERG